MYTLDLYRGNESYQYCFADKVIICTLNFNVILYIPNIINHDSDHYDN